MIFPNTPNTIISQLSDDEKISIWNGAWSRFFDIYHAPINLMVSKSFRVNNWNDVPKQVIDDVVSDVSFHLIKIFRLGKYDKNRSKFRFFLKAIAYRRTVDFIRANTSMFKSDSLDDEEKELNDLIDEAYKISFLRQLEDDEELAFKQSFLLDLYNSIRHKFHPKTCAAFELVKFEGKSVEYVSKELELSSNTINNDIYRIIKKLREVALKSENIKEFKNE